MSIEPQTNENACLINKDWADDDTLEKIVKYEYQKADKSEYIEEDIELLKKNRLKVLGDWKELCTHTTFLERSSMTNAGLVLLLHRVASIEPENVGVLKRKREEDFQKQQIRKYEKNLKNWSRNGTVVKDQSYFYVERTNLIKEFYSKLNKPNEMVFYVYCGPRASGKSSFTKSLLPPENGINILFEFYNFNSKHHC
jgi:hypothetical protein